MQPPLLPHPILPVRSSRNAVGDAGAASLAPALLSLAALRALHLLCVFLRPGALLRPSPSTLLLRWHSRRSRSGPTAAAGPQRALRSRRGARRSRRPAAGCK